MTAKKTLREENAALGKDLAKLASINEVLQAENRSLKAKLTDPKVADLASKESGKLLPTATP